MPAAMGGAERLGGIFDDGQVVFFAQGPDGIDSSGHAVEMHGEDAFGLGIGAGDPALAGGDDGLFQVLGAHVPATGLGIDENGDGALVADGIDGSGKGKTLHKDQIAGAYAFQDEGQVDGSSAARKGRGVADAVVTLEIGFEVIDMRTERGDPVVRKCFIDELLLRSAHLGGGEPDLAIHN